MSEHEAVDTTANLTPWPPAPQGNLRAATHGAYSDRLTEPETRELYAATFAANPHLDEQRDGAAVARYARLLARIERAQAWLDAQDDDVFADPGDGRTHALLDRLDKWTGAASRAEQRLAIDPLTRARLGLTHAQAFDLARYWAEQDQRPEGGARG